MNFPSRRQPILPLLALLFAFNAEATSNNIKLGETRPEATNTVSVNINPANNMLQLDVHDSFAVMEMLPTKLKYRIDFGVVDGLRSTYGNCTSGRMPKLGDPISTIVSFEYGNVDSLGRVPMMISRPLDFSGNAQVYEFRAVMGQQVILESGISVLIDDGRVSYLQMTGPIGPRGRESLKIAFDLDHGKTLNGEISIDTNAWLFSIAKDGGKSVVNGVSFLADNSQIPAPVASPIQTKNDQEALVERAALVDMVRSPLVSTYTAEIQICPLIVCDFWTQSPCIYYGYWCGCPLGMCRSIN
jgi:hypothetical protein